MPGGVLRRENTFLFSFENCVEGRVLNTMSKYSTQLLRNELAALQCFTSQREVILKKSDSKLLAVLQIKAIKLIGLIRSPLQPKKDRLFHLGSLPLIEGYQQNPQPKGYGRTLHLKMFWQ